jgi:hypothetical protein
VANHRAQLDVQDSPDPAKFQAVGHRAQSDVMAMLAHHPKSPEATRRVQSDARDNPVQATR